MDKWYSDAKHWFKKQAPVDSHFGGACQIHPWSIPIPRWGWTLDLNDQVWLPVWSNLQMASKACNGLIKCAGLVKVAMVRSHTGFAQIFAIVNVTVM